MDHPINNFNGGEINVETMQHRFDINKYNSSCAKIENALPLISGGVRKMPGTYYVGASKYSDRKSRLEPFVFNEDQAYVVEFGHEYIRFYTNSGLLMNIAPEPPYVDYSYTTSYSAADVSVIGHYWECNFGSSKIFYLVAPYGQDVKNLVIYFMTNPLTYPPYTIAPSATVYGSNMIIVTLGTTSSSNNYIAINSVINGLGTVNGVDVSQWIVVPTSTYNASPPVTGDMSGNYAVGTTIYQALATTTGDFPPVSPTKWTIPSTSIVELSTTYQEADLFDLDVTAHSADVLYVFHKNYPPKRLERNSTAIWSLSAVTFKGTTDIAKVGYSGIAKPIVGITKANPAVVTCNNHGFSNGNEVYISGVSGMPEVNQGRYTITYINANSFSIGTNSSNFGTYDTGGTAVKVETLFATEGNYPACGIFYEQRLILGGSTNHPNRLNGSVQGDFHNFISDPALDDYAIQFDLVSSSVEQIRWFGVQTSKLITGTMSGGWTLSGTNGPLSATNIDARKHSTLGVAQINPKNINENLIYIGRNTVSSRILKYEWQNDQWISPELTRLADHIFKASTLEFSGVKQTALQSNPFSIMWFIRNDGQLVGLVFDAQEQVYAFFRLVTDGEFESVAVIAADAVEDRVWVKVKRTIDGVTARYVEYFTVHDIWDIKNSCYVHSGLTWNGGFPWDITSITNANPAVVTCLGHPFQNGDKIRIITSDIYHPLQCNDSLNLAYTVANRTSTTFELSGIDSTSMGNFVSRATAQKVAISVSGLSHLEKKEVAICVDGIAHEKRTVTSGAITLDRYGNIITVGLPFTAIVTPLPLAFMTNTGINKGKKQRIVDAYLSFSRLGYGLKIGPAEDSVLPIDHPDVILNNGAYVSDSYRLEFMGDWSETAKISFVHDEPLPMTLNAIIPNISVSL